MFTDAFSYKYDIKCDLIFLENESVVQNQRQEKPKCAVHSVNLVLPNFYPITYIFSSLKSTELRLVSLVWIQICFVN